MKVLRRNLGLKILALVLALLACAYVKTLAQPVADIPTQRVYTKPLVVVPPSEPDLLASISHSEVTVTLKGTKAVLDRIAPSLISAEVDLSQRDKPGNTLESITVLAPGGAEVSELSPSYVWAQVSKRQVVSVPVRVELSGQPIKGYRIGTPSIVPDKLRVVGGQEDVDRVAAVVVPISVGGVSHTFSTRAGSTNVVDANGQLVDGIEIRDSMGVDVTVPVLTLSQVKISLKNVEVVGRSGWNYVKTVEPETLVLEAEPSMPPPSVVLTEPYKFKHSSKPQTHSVTLKIPEGFSVTTPNDLDVLVNVIPSKTATKGDTSD